MNTGGRPGANRPGFSRFAFCIRSSYTVGAPAAISRRNAPRVIKSARAGNAVDVPPVPQCALVAPGVRSVGWTNDRHRPGQTQAPVRKPAQNRDSNWAHGRHQCQRHPGCALAALYACRPLSLMVARGGLRRSAAARERTLPGSLGRGPLPAFPGCRLRVRLCGERAAQAEAEVERSEGEGEAQGRPVVGGALRFRGVGVDFALH